MKKVLLFFAFAFFATITFASEANSQPKSLGTPLEQSLSTPTPSPEAACILCTMCKEHMLLCAVGSNCEQAALLLAEMWESSNCVGSSTD